MRKLLHNLYCSLPVIRELRNLAYITRQQNAQLIKQNDQLIRLKTAEYEKKLLASPRYDNPKRLNRYEYQVFSQFGEDGIIAEIFRRIGMETRVFLEIGVGDGLENNTAFRLSQGWSGYWIDGNEESIQFIRYHCKNYVNTQNLHVLKTFVKSESIVNDLKLLNVPNDLDFLSLDIDRNTYWLWRSLGYLRPRVIAVEYNAQFPPDVEWKVDYASDRMWNNSTYYGASLKAYELLGRELGYSLVGCSTSGVNAFFVRSDLCEDKFMEPFTSENHFEPFRMYLHRRKSVYTPALNDD